MIFQNGTNKEWGSWTRTEFQQIHLKIIFKGSSSLTRAEFQIYNNQIHMKITFKDSSSSTRAESQICNK